MLNVLEEDSAEKQCARSIRKESRDINILGCISCVLDDVVLDSTSLFRREPDFLTFLHFKLF